MWTRLTHSDRSPDASSNSRSPKRRPARLVGYMLIGVGIVLLGMSGLYHGYKFWARTTIDDYTSIQERPTANIQDNIRPIVKQDVIIPIPTVALKPEYEPPGQQIRAEVFAKGLSAEHGPTPEPSPVPLETPTPLTINTVLAKESSEPSYKEILALALVERIDNSAIEAAKYMAPGVVQAGTNQMPATRIRIPVVGIDSEVLELGVIEMDESRAWETPKNVVGHIPTTSVPGAQGQGWYFGHLESPLSGEGNVFRSLPELAELVKSHVGKPFYIFMETPGYKFAYQVYRTEIVHEDSLAVTDSGQDDIVLVTCYPRFVYDHRMLITAALVGVIKSES